MAGMSSGKFELVKTKTFLQKCKSFTDSNSQQNTKDTAALKPKVSKQLSSVGNWTDLASNLPLLQIKALNLVLHSVKALNYFVY